MGEECAMPSFKSAADAKIRHLPSKGLFGCTAKHKRDKRFKAMRLGLVILYSTDLCSMPPTEQCAMPSLEVVWPMPAEVIHSFPVSRQTSLGFGKAASFFCFCLARMRMHVGHFFGMCAAAAARVRPL